MKSLIKFLARYPQTAEWMCDHFGAKVIRRYFSYFCAGVMKGDNVAWMGQLLVMMTNWPLVPGAGFTPHESMASHLLAHRPPQCLGYLRELQPHGHLKEITECIRTNFSACHEYNSPAFIQRCKKLSAPAIRQSLDAMFLYLNGSDLTPDDARHYFRKYFHSTPYVVNGTMMCYLLDKARGWGDGDPLGNYGVINSNTLFPVCRLLFESHIQAPADMHDATRVATWFIHQYAKDNNDRPLWRLLRDNMNCSNPVLEHTASLVETVLQRLFFPSIEPLLDMIHDVRTVEPGLMCFWYLRLQQWFAYHPVYKNRPEYLAALPVEWLDK